MEKLYLYGITILALIIGAMSFVLMRKNRKIEDLYDDLLDLQAELKLKGVERKLLDKRKAYEEAIKKYTDAVLKHNAVDVVFLLDTPAAPSGGTQPADRPDTAASLSVRPSTKVLH